MNIVACEPTTVAELKAAHMARRARLGLVPPPVPFPVDGRAPRPIEAMKVRVCIRKATEEEMEMLSRDCAAIRAAHGWPVPSYGGVASARFPIELRPRAQIAREVMQKHGLSWACVVSSRRFAHEVRARQELMWRLQRETTMSLTQIGRFLGGRDHTTVLHGARRHQLRIDGSAR